jgi:hypothetical protein
MKENNDYLTDANASIKPYLGFDKDFRNPGDFQKTDADNEICLLATIWPGMYNGNKWLHQTKSDNDSYMIAICYRNKNHVQVIFDASYDTGENMRKSFNFVKKAAKKFFLKNLLIDKGDYPRGWISKSPEWKDIEEYLAKVKNLSDDLRTGNSWDKLMTVAEAKELFEYLKIKVVFPY